MWRRLACSAISSAAIQVHGVDVVPELIDKANKEGDSSFQVLAYEDLSQDTIQKKFDVVVCNFSLLGKESVIKVFESVPELLNDDGYFIVQTIHPIAGCGDETYVDGWRKGSWTGLSNGFTNPPPWYFRTLDTWKSLFLKNGLTLHKIIEPIHPETNVVASIIFVGRSSLKQVKIKND